MACLSAASAQAQPASRFDTAIVRTATLGSLLRSARAADSIAMLATAQPTTHSLIERLRSQLERPELQRQRLRLLAQRQAAVGVIARSQRPVAFTSRDAGAQDTLAMVMEQALPDALTPVLGRDATTRLLDTLEAFNVARRRVSMANSPEELQRFERTYGPDAPRLNAVEVGPNFAAQWIPGFRPNAEGWPSRLEVIASYVPTYLTMTGGKARAVTVVELGPRVYLW